MRLFGRLIPTVPTPDSARKRHAEIMKRARQTETDLKAAAPDFGKRWAAMGATVKAFVLIGAAVIGVLVGLWLLLSGQFVLLGVLVTLGLFATGEKQIGPVTGIQAGALVLGALGASGVVGWISELTLGLDHPSESTHGFYVSGLGAAIVIAVAFLLFRSGLSNRVVLFAGTAVFIISWLLLGVLSIMDDIGIFGDALVILAVLALLFWGALWYGFGNLVGTVLALLALSAAYASWLVYSDEAGTRTGYYLDTHISQLGNGVTLILVGLVVFATWRNLVKPDEEDTESADEDDDPLMGGVFEQERKRPSEKADGFGFLKKFLDAVEREYELTDEDVERLHSDEFHDQYQAFRREQVIRILEEDHREQSVLTNTKRLSKKRIKEVLGERGPDLVTAADVSEVDLTLSDDTPSNPDEPTEAVTV